MNLLNNLFYRKSKARIKSQIKRFRGRSKTFYSVFQSAACPKKGRRVKKGNVCEKSCATFLEIDCKTSTHIFIFTLVVAYRVCKRLYGCFLFSVSWKDDREMSALLLVPA